MDKDQIIGQGVRTMVIKRMVDDLFDSFKHQFVEWVETKPTGEFNINIPVHDGGFRERPKITRTEAV